MNNQLAAQNTNTVVAQNVEEIRINLQNFLTKLNGNPSPESIDKTPDGKASTILISHIEMLLDEYFFGLWETENFKWSVVANEVVGSIDLCFYHPTAGIRMRRTGAAAIQIMVDKGANPLDVNAKKSNALDMGFPKLKAECIKNAANSLGKLFGRDLNRKKQDVYKPLISKKDKLTETLNKLNQSENV
jgi:hypothetical protein